MLGTIVVRGYDLLWRTPISQILPNEAVKTAARTSIHPSLCLCIEAEPGSAGCGEHWRRSCAHFFRLLRRRHPRREGKARKGRREPDFLSFRIRLFETNFLGPQGCLNKKHTCGEPTAGVAHTFPGGIQGPGRGVTAHQRAPPEKATGPARLAHPGFGLELAWTSSGDLTAI